MKIHQTHDLIRQILAHAATRLPNIQTEDDMTQWVGVTSAILFEAVKRRNMPVDQVYDRAVKAVETKFRTEAADRMMRLELPFEEEVESDEDPSNRITEPHRPETDLG